MRVIKLFVVICLFVQTSFSQHDSVPSKENQKVHILEPSKDLNKGRSRFLMIGTAATGGGSLLGLSYLWYSQYRSGGFHWFNDGLQWRGMDKIGHAYISYFICDYVNNWYLWAGVNRKAARNRAIITSVAFQSTVEILDGFSAGWGASPLDIVANMSGVGFFLLNSEVLKNKYFTLKYGFYPSEYRKHRPSQLGENVLFSTLKDYNGQSYWVSFNLSEISNSSKIPSWLNLAVGYGAEGMVGSTVNPSVNNNGDPIPSFQRYSQVFLSPDIDWKKIKTKNVYLKTLFKALSLYKFPFPTLEYNGQNQFKFNWLH